MINKASVIISILAIGFTLFTIGYQLYWDGVWRGRYEVMKMWDDSKPKTFETRTFGTDSFIHYEDPVK